MVPLHYLFSGMMRYTQKPGATVPEMGQLYPEINIAAETASPKETQREPIFRTVSEANIGAKRTISLDDPKQTQCRTWNQQKNKLKKNPKQKEELNRMKTPTKEEDKLGLKETHDALERFRKEYWENDKELSSTYQFLMHPNDDSEPDEDFNQKVNELQLMIDDLKLLRKLGFK